MKLLVIGIDGGTADIFDAFDMPFWQSLRARNISFDVTEDLNQRGWARMISGKGAEETGALYMRPKLGQPQTFSISYGYKDLSKTDGFVPIWELASKTGAKIGLMGVPTTSPAQEVDGFYISGGGGGIMQGDLPADAAFPDSARRRLVEGNYIFDTRLGAQTFDNAKVLGDHLNTMMERRGAIFSTLAREHEIDFGFLAFRATTVLLYLASSEIARMMQRPKDDPKRHALSPGWLEIVNAHMRQLDDTMARLFDELQPENYILTSDHSIVPWTHNVDFNGFLADAGIARFKGTAKLAAKNAAKAALRKNTRSAMLSAPAGSAVRSAVLTGARLDNSAPAFGAQYVYGLYINDSRFAGVVPDADVAGEVERVIEEFNWAALRQGADLKAAPYRAGLSGKAASDLLPDVTILQNGHAFPSQLGPNWYQPHPNFGPVRTVKGVKGMHSGQKGIHPILMANPELANLRDESDPIDLRLVHTLTRKLFQGS